MYVPGKWNRKRKWMKKIISSLIVLSFLLASLPTYFEAGSTSSFDTDFQNYLKDVSQKRGIKVTKDDIEVALYMRGEKELKDFASVQKLSDYLGPIILSDYSNLSDTLTTYNMTLEDLQGMMDKNDEVMEDYIYVKDLEDMIDFYSNTPGEMDEEFIELLLGTLESELGFSKDEQERVIKHLEGLEAKLSSEETINQLNRISEDMQKISDFDTIDEITPETTAKIMSLFNEMLSIFELKLDFTLIKGKAEERITLIDLMNMTELVNASVKVDVYNLKGEFLADIILKGETVDSKIIKDIGKDIDNTTVKINEVKTENGGKLPDTAGNYFTKMIFGLILMVISLYGIRYVRRTA